MASASARYLLALLRAAPLESVARAAVQRLTRPEGLRIPAAATAAEARAAAEALTRAPAIFSDGKRHARALYRLLFPSELPRLRRRAEETLARRVELFGHRHHYAGGLDFHLDPLRGRRFDPTRPAPEIALLAPGADPRLPWELGRGGHLLELGVAANLFPGLAPAARRAIAGTIIAFLDGNALGHGIHWASPLEVALRAVHWLAALELAGLVPGDAAPPRLRLRLGGALVEHARFLAANLEDRGAVPGNHLVGDLVGLFVVALAIGEEALAAEALARLGREAERQVHPDGAGFEGSTAYHRFVLELLLCADCYAGAAGLDAGVAPALHRMLQCSMATLAPDGTEPGFGDGDEGRCLPVHPRAPRDHGYLLSLGAVRFGDAQLKPPGARFSPEAVWLGGAAGYRAFRRLDRACASPARVRSLPDGGVHVLSAGRAHVAMRCGGYGQRGVGGHAHNDQLAISVHLDGEPLIADPGTCAYTADPLLRDRFRGTAAHATVLVEGEEQSPILEGRPFALPDAAHARILDASDRGTSLRLEGTHGGYLRLRQRVRHTREVLLDPLTGALRITDRLDGQGLASVEARYPLGGLVARPLDGEAERALLRRAIEAADWPDVRVAWVLAIVILRAGVPVAALIPLGDTPAGSVERSERSPRWGQRARDHVVRFARRSPLPTTIAVAMLSLKDEKKTA